MCLFSLLFYTSLVAISPLEKQIIEEYTPTRELCRAIINKDVYIPGKNQIEREMSCLLLGFRPIALITLPFFNALLDDTQTEDQAFNALKKLLKEKIDAQKISTLLFENNQILLFSPQGKNNAMLLDKSDKNKKLNEYLFGFLLGYQLKDIDFYYAVKEFQNKHNWQMPPSYEFYYWPEKLKKEFAYFEKYEWPKMEKYRKYLQDKSDAQKWLLFESQK